MEKTKLTEPRRQILEFIRERHARTGIYPSVREIARHMKFGSTNTVHYHIKHLVEAGALVRKGRLARSFVLSEGAGSRRKSSAQRSQAEQGVPLVGRVAAGEPILAEQNVDGLVNFRSYFHCSDDTFALRVQGDSMIESGIVDGDLVIVRTQPRVENGEIGVAIIGDEATVKRIFDEGPQWRLQPENASMKPLMVRKGEKQFAIAGKVIGVVRKI
jgi:repressor LexA